MKPKIFFVFLFVAIFSQISFAQFYAKLKGIAAGENDTIALADDNSLWACGGDKYKSSYQLGLGDGVYRTPLLQRVYGPNGVGHLNNIITFDAGWVHSLAVVNGFCYAWGLDSHMGIQGMLGNGPNEGDSSVPILVHGLNNDSNGLQNIIKVSAGRSGKHSLAVDSSGYVYAWGYNEYGQCGDGSMYNIKEWPILVLSTGEDPNNNSLGEEANIVDVDAGVHHSLALVKYEDGGYVYQWGNGLSVPQKVTGLRNIIDIATCDVSLAVDVNGFVWQWYTGYPPTRVPGGNMGTDYLEHIVKVAAGYETYAAIDCNGQVWQWYKEDANPVKVAAGQMETESGFLEDINAIDVGYSDHLVAVDKYGNGWGWSTNDGGQLGVGDYSYHFTPTEMLCPLICEPNVWNIDQNTHFTSIQDAIDACTTVSGDTLVAYPALYCERPDFDSKQLTLRSFDPNNHLIVACTRILGDEYNYTVTVGTDSTINGFTLIGGSDYYGIYCINNSNPTVNNCRIVSCMERGISCEGNSAVITNTLINNLTYYGIYAENSDITVDRCQIAANDGVCGIYVYDGSAEITNSIIHHNNYGIQLNNTQSSEIRNNTIVENDYGIYRSDGNDPDVSNNIIWGGSPINWQSAKIKYNCIQDCIETYGNINDNPEFRNADAYDYHLKYNSPCIDMGDPNFIAEANETDIDSETRVNNGRVDIGFDEFYYCSGRVDIFPNQPDGIVNFLDFVVLANAWLMADGNDHFNDIVDFDSDGSIDAVDLKQFCDCWLWTTNFYEPVFDIQGDLMMSQQTSQAEQAAVSEAVVVQVEPQIVEIEPVVFDVNEILDWLDNLWETDEEIRGMIDPNSWLEFIESIKSSE